MPTILPTQQNVPSDLTVGIIGLGYVGLPTAIGFPTLVYRLKSMFTAYFDMVLQGKNPTGDPDVDDIVPRRTERWHNHFCSEAVPNCDVVLVTVPTPITHDLKPDLSYVEAAGRDVFKSITKGSRTIVV